ncbi:MAG: DEAD/DEAH box helicase, partial [candidate division Zixibacteria bacterium]|nr:DEAD/DEAH box helicase [candidate division Zixibacteria bacterium]
MNLNQLLDSLRADDKFRSNLTFWKTFPARPPRYVDFPENIDHRLTQALAGKGVSKLYTHQRKAIDIFNSGKNPVVVTPTASGKTLCYNLPVLQKIIENPEARALYLFPTKALSQDQLSGLTDVIDDLGINIKTYTFDGDTPATARSKIRKAGHIVITNPDMLHTGILPHHPRWINLFENLKIVVIDEVHHYRGVFGSHLANVMRRLKRICDFYGSKPQFICCSATIANPKELAERVTGVECELVDYNGAPSGEKHFLLYNPPVVNSQLGIRKSSLLEARDIARMFLGNNIQTIIFARSRLRVEILTTYLKEAAAKMKFRNDAICGYRGGYLPNERRRIERGLRNGEVRAVVSTNALELGIDIGQLQAAVIVGYPGNIASSWQQAGRAGRSAETSVAVMVATSSPLDQFMVAQPGYFFGTSPESGIVDPENLMIKSSHIKCASFELPFSEEETFGENRHESTKPILEFLNDAHVLHKSGGKYHWASEIYPAEEISLRTAAPQNFVIMDQTKDNRVIGEVDYFSASELIHPDAIYLHQDEQFQVAELDWEGKKAYVKPSGVDYYTDAESKTNIEVLNIDENNPEMASENQLTLKWGSIAVRRVTVSFKKIKFFTHENVGWGKLDMPELEMQTTSFWLELPGDARERFGFGEEKLGGCLQGVSNLMNNITPMWIMSDPSDIRAVAMVRAPFTERPTI